MIGRGKPCVFPVRPVALTTLITFLLILSLPFLLVGSTNAEAVAQQIKFTGTAIRFEPPYGIGGGDTWWVRVEDVPSGLQPCENPIAVSFNCPYPPFDEGYVDPDIEVGDPVEVFGVQESGPGRCYIHLPNDCHYIRKVRGPDEAKFIGTVIEIPAPYPSAGDSIWAVRVENEISGPDLCEDRVAVYFSNWHSQGYVSPDIQVGDKVEVLGGDLGWDAYGRCYWAVCVDKSHHYIKKISAPPTNQPPVAQLSVSPLAVVRVGDTIAFDGSGSYDPDGHIVSYFFDFGDGSNSGWTSSSVGRHSYSHPGVYETTLKVKDDDGLESPWTKVTFLNNGGVFVVYGEIKFRGTVSDRDPVTVVDVDSVIEGPDHGGNEIRVTRVEDDALLPPDPSLRVGDQVEVRGSYMLIGEDCNTYLIDPEPYHYIRKVQEHMVSKPNTPSGPSTGKCNAWLTFSTGGASCNQGHPVQYRFDFGDGTISPWSSSTSVYHRYSGTGTFYVKAQARCSSDHSVVSSWSSSKSVRITCEHTVSKPNTPSGPSSGKCNAALTFSSSGASCNRGHSVQYRFDFGDGTTTSWNSSASASHTYSHSGTFYVKAQARCSSDYSVVSSWSSSKSVRVTCEHTVNWNLRVQVHEATGAGKMIPGATVLVDGSPRGTTDSNGEITLSVTQRQHTVTASKSGCTPHPGTGSWTGVVDHNMGIAIEMDCGNEPSVTITDFSATSSARPNETISASITVRYNFPRESHVGLSIRDSADSTVATNSDWQTSRLGQGTLSYTLTFQAPSSPGSYTYTVLARYWDGSQWVTTDTQPFTLNISSRKQPDLVVEDIYWRPINPTEEDSLGLYIKLWNKGNKDAGSFYVSLSVDGDLLTERRLDGLPSGKRTILMISEGSDDWSWKHDCDVSHTLKAFADAHHEIVESDESNNTLEKSIRVECVEPSGSFTAKSFTAHCLESGPYANHIDCELSYQNDLGEQALIVFIFKKASTGEVIGKARPYGLEGSSGVGALFECPPGEPGTYRLSWEAYRASDIYAQNPVAWCEPGDELNIGCPCESVDIPETTVVLDSATQQVMTEVTADEIHFSSSTSLLDSLEVGDIVASGITDAAPYGLLRNVEGIDRGYGVTLQTTQAKLVDAVNKGSISITDHQLKQSDVVSTSAAAGVTMRPEPQSQEYELTFKLKNVVLYQGYGGKVTASGEVNVTAEFSFNVDIGWGGIEFISFETTMEEKADLEIDANVEVDDGMYSKEVYRWQFAPVTVLIGPLPVVVYPVLAVNVSVSGEVTAGITTKVEQDATFTAELIYDDGSWYTPATYSSGFEYDDPEYSTECDMRGSAGPELALLLYGVVGPYVNVEGYLTLEVDCSDAFCENAQWEFCGGLEVNGGVKFEVLTYKVDEQFDLFDLELFCVDGSTESEDTTDPTVTITSPSTDQEFTKGDNITFEWEGEDNKTEVYDLEYACRLKGRESGYTGFHKDWTEETYEDLDAGEYTFYVKARDEAGNEGKASLSFTVASSPEPNELKACFSASPSSGEAPLEVDFDSGCSEGDIEDYEWDFNDNGATSTEGTPSHTFSEEGDYDVELTIKGSDGQEATTTRTIEVTAPAEPAEPEARFEWAKIDTYENRIVATCEIVNTGDIAGDFQIRLYAQLDASSRREWPDKKQPWLAPSGALSRHRVTDQDPLVLYDDDLDFAPDSYEYVWLELWQVETKPYTLCDTYGDEPPGLGLANSQLVFAVTCPVDLEVTDPDGLMVSKESSEIPDATYTEKDLNGDGDPDDQIVIPNRKIGDYQVRVIPESRAKPTDTYTLEVSAGGEFETLAEEQQIKDIPDEPYQFESTSGETTSIQLSPGWTMVSSPLSGESALDLFGTSVYRWNPATRKYDKPTTIDPSKGYWVKLLETTVVTCTGTEVTADVIIDISSRGWHQISAPWPYQKGDIQVSKAGVTKSWVDAAVADWVREAIYGYKSTDGEYTTPSTIDPWYGYWVRADSSGLSLKLLYASRTSVSPPTPPTAFAPLDLPSLPGSTLTAPLPENLEFTNIPNPITDVDTTTFMVKGVAAVFVAAIKVQIYDLSGRLVYENEEAGTSMEWHTENDYGEILANGVYLYKMYALIGGRWIESETKKLVILR